MDYQGLVDSITAVAAVYAFDILPDGTLGEIRLMAINSYYAAILPFVNPQAPPFQPNTPYKLYFRDINFEKFVYRCVTTNEILYSCANAHGAWIHGMYLPLVSPGENVGYCCYVSKHTEEPDSLSASGHSAQVSSEVLNVCIDLLRSRDFDKAMTRTVQNLREICGAEYCNVYTFNQESQTCRLYTEYGESVELFERICHQMGRTPYETMYSWEQDLAGSDCLILDDLQVIKERDPIWYASLCDWHIQSIVFYAVRFKQKLVGFIMSANFDTQKMMHIKETVELTTFFIGTVVANQHLLGRLEFMSMTDILTQVKNRNAMNIRLDLWKRGETPLPDQLGIVYIDLNGMKRMNDQFGHAAGDRMLQETAYLIKKAFQEEEIYRIGGDEFLVLAPEISEDKLERSIARLRELTAASRDVNCAIGSGLFKADYDITAAMRAVDEKMYQDKNEYYCAHPEINRRS